MGILHSLANVRYKADEPPPGGTPPPEPPAPPAAVTREEFLASQQKSDQTLAQLTETLNALRQQLAAPPPRQEAAPTAEITPEQYAEAIRTGDGDTALRYMRQVEERTTKTANARIAEIEAAGTESIAGVIEATAIATLPYYKKYEKEVKDLIKTMPPQARINPEAQRHAYYMVVGRHTDEITAEERDKAVRAAANPKPDAALAPGGSSRSVGASGDSGIVTPHDLGGDEAERAMAAVGRDPDRVARGLGYGSWKDYMEKTAEYRK